MSGDDWEVIGEGDLSYRQRWECESPGSLGSDVAYRVIRDGWNADFTERTIYEWEPAEKETGPGGNRVPHTTTDHA